MATTAVPKVKISGGSFLLETRQPDEVFTPEDFTEQHQMIGQTAEEFAVNEIVPNIDKIEHKDFSVTRDLLSKAGELGLSSVEIPEAYGGMEMDKVTAAVIADHIAKYAGFATTWGGHTGIGTLPLVYFGTEEQKKKYLPRLASGEIVGAYALSESTSGSDALNCRTRATLSPDGKHYILNGEKMWITNAGFADLFTVFAKIDGEKFSAFLVERTFPGFSVGAEEHKMGIRGSSTCPIILNDCKVPVENLLGEIGKGHLIAFNILNVGRFKLGAMCVGGGRVSLENAIGYAKQRKAFSKVIADFGLVREKIANMATLLYVGESLVYRTVGMMDSALGEVDKSAADAAKADAEGDRGVRGRVLDHQGLGLGDDRLRRRRDPADLCRLRICRRVSRGARLSRRPHQPHLRRHQRNQPPDHHRLLAEARDVGPIAADARHQEADGRSAVRPIDREELEGALAEERKLVAQAKKLGLFAAGAATQKYMQAIQDQQEIMGAIADMTIETYAMESAVLRAQKIVGSKGRSGGRVADRDDARLSLASDGEGRIRRAEK